MNKQTLIISILLTITIVILVGAPESLAYPQYVANLTEVYGDGSCITCHVNASGGGPRNSYGTLFENQDNHYIDPSAALIAIGPPPSSNATPLITPTATMTPATTETPIETATTEVTTATATATPAAPGFEIVLSLVGLFAMAILARRNNK